MSAAGFPEEKRAGRRHGPRQAACLLSCHRQESHGKLHGRSGPGAVLTVRGIPQTGHRWRLGAPVLAVGHQRSFGYGSSVFCQCHAAVNVVTQ